VEYVRTWFLLPVSLHCVVLRSPRRCDCQDCSAVSCLLSNSVGFCCAVRAFQGSSVDCAAHKIILLWISAQLLYFALGNTRSISNLFALVCKLNALLKLYWCVPVASIAKQPGSFPPKCRTLPCLTVILCTS